MSSTHRRRLSKERLLDLGLVTLIGIVAFIARHDFNQNSRPVSPFMGDARQYYNCGLNLRVHGAFSKAWPDFEAPTTRSGRAIGYPIFLAALMSQEDTEESFVGKVQFIQSILGTLTTVFCYLIARFGLHSFWSFLASFFCAISPHLIVLDHYILSESLFTFFLTFGVLLLLTGVRLNKASITLLGSILIAASGQTRSIGLLLPFPLIVGVGFVCGSRFLPGSRKQMLLQVSGCLVGFLAVFLGDKYFEAKYVYNLPTVEVQTNADYKTGYQLRAISRTLRPPNFLVRGQSFLFIDHRDPTWELATDEPFSEVPLTYVYWNLWGRWTWVWNFDTIWVGDVYHLKMVKSGFEDRSMLMAYHSMMRRLHWPLYFFAVVGCGLLLFRVLRGSVASREILFLLPCIGMLYFVGVTNVLQAGGHWCPRYTVPARPFSFVIAAYLLCALCEVVRVKARGLFPVSVDAHAIKDSDNLEHRAKVGRRRKRR